MLNFTQTIPFNTSKGGTTPNFCLSNVCKGYGIGPKYGSAWEAWEHTEQHLDPVPDNLDVPIYYSYTTTIDGVTQNFGHINVRLKNGTVWSDGNIYASIEDYTSKKLPRFVGWGESVNDVKVIGDNMIDAAHQATLFVAYLGRLPEPAEVTRDVGNKTTDTMINELDSSSEYADKKKRDATAYAALANQVDSFTPYSGPELFTKNGG